MAQITTLPGIVQQFDVATQDQLDRLETVVAQNTIALLNIPLDGEDMIYWLGKINTIEIRQQAARPEDFPAWLETSVALDPATGRTLVQGTAFINQKPVADGTTIYLNETPRIGVNPTTTTTLNGGAFSFDFTALPNTTYYVTISTDGQFYQRAVAYHAG